MTSMISLRSIDIKRGDALPDRFPFTLPFIEMFGKLEFPSPVTFFVGENGSGKSTLLEGVAAGAGSIVIGGEPLQKDRTLEHARLLAKHLKFVWNRKTHRGFLMRAEDFFRFSRKIFDEIRDLEEQAREYEERFDGYALQLARGAALGQKDSLTSKYGEDLHAVSHGESFLQVLRERFVPKGLYLLDEPETPLSPLSQLALIAMIKGMVTEGGSQFIIATHSPVLLAFPGAAIYSFDNCPLKRVGYEELEHVTFTRNFLNNPESYLRRL